MVFAGGAVLFALFINLACFALIVTLLVLAIKALRKYLSAPRTDAARQQTAAVRRSLAQAIAQERGRCGMTQEFVAGQLGVSRQAVSKWERGESEPSTSNLLALAKLFGISPAQLLAGIEMPDGPAAPENET